MSDTPDLTQRLTTAQLIGGIEHRLQQINLGTYLVMPRDWMEQACDLLRTVGLQPAPDGSRHTSVPNVGDSGHPAELITLRAQLADALNDKMALIHRANRAEIALAEAQAERDDIARGFVEAERLIQTALLAAEARADALQAERDARVLCAEVNARAWAADRAELMRARDLAIAHDTQPYPTAEAYELVCAARDKHQARADAAERALREIGSSLVADQGRGGGSSCGASDREKGCLNDENQNRLLPRILVSRNLASSRSGVLL